MVTPLPELVDVCVPVFAVFPELFGKEGERFDLFNGCCKSLLLFASFE